MPTLMDNWTHDAASKHTITPTSLHAISIHPMAPPQLRQQTYDYSLLLICQPWKDERLSWLGWLTCSGLFTHISGHSSAAGGVQDRESCKWKTGVPVLCHATNTNFENWSLLGEVISKNVVISFWLKVANNTIFLRYHLRNKICHVFLIT